MLQSVAIGIVVINLVIQGLCIVLTRLVGYHDYSVEISRSCRFIFYGQFINFTLAQVIANANFKNTPFNFIQQGNAQFHDFSSDFYATVGSIVYKTMMIKSFLPWLKCLGFTLGTNIKRRKDSGMTAFDKIPRTKCLTIKQFVTIHAGPEVKLDLQYAYIFLMVYTTFTFGVALPLLFPICAFAMTNLYITEKI